MRLRASFALPLFLVTTTAGATYGQMPVPASKGLVSISVCPDSSRLLPRDLQSAFDAVVVVGAGATIGSGVIISREGYAVTAAHVVSGLNEVAVSLHSGDRLTAQVVSVDAPQGIALIRLPGRGYACLPVTRKATPPVGTHVYAIGAPAADASSYSVATGIISSFRPLSGYSYLQTDAVLKSGHGGGPILTRDGRVIAVVSWNVAAVGFEGLAFGVPLDAVSRRLLLNWR
jgi:serine protease Do